MAHAHLGLLDPGEVVHAREDEDALRRDADAAGVGEHEAHERRDDAGLARLHLGRQVEPGALGLGHEEVEEALERGEHLGREGVLGRLGLVGAPAELGLPGREAEAGRGDLEVGIGELGVEGVHLLLVAAGCDGGVKVGDKRRMAFNFISKVNRNFLFGGPWGRLQIFFRN